MTDYEVVWDGRGALPWQVGFAGGWQQKRNVVLEAAPPASEMMTRKETETINRNTPNAEEANGWGRSRKQRLVHPVECACGRKVTGRRWTCWSCHRKNRNLRRRRTTA